MGVGQVVVVARLSELAHLTDNHTYWRLYFYSLASEMRATIRVGQLN